MHDAFQPDSIREYMHVCLLIISHYFVTIAMHDAFLPECIYGIHIYACGTL